MVEGGGLLLAETSYTFLHCIVLGPNFVFDICLCVTLLPALISRVNIFFLLNLQQQMVFLLVGENECHYIVIKQSKDLNI